VDWEGRGRKEEASLHLIQVTGEEKSDKKLMLLPSPLSIILGKRGGEGGK